MEYDRRPLKLLLAKRRRSLRAISGRAIDAPLLPARLSGCVCGATCALFLLIMESGSANAVADAVLWITGLLSGSLALGVAIIAVAAIGYLAFWGRIDLRRSAGVIAGCFLVFGAATIALGIQSALAGGDGTGSDSSPMIAPPPPLPMAAMPAVNAQPYDPYAGAALPQR